jgi:asparagine synthase (glutamine-hydrolysing)
MSGIAVIHNLDGRPADAKLMTLMLDAIAHRAVDARAAWLDGAVAMGHAAMHTTPEDAEQRQPHRVGDGAQAVCLVFDGRVDNRAELRAALLAAGAVPRENTDAELVLRAWLCWGQDSPRQIIGDFAYAIWDGRRQSLFCARDTGGIRPLCYFCDGRILLCGSELHQILQSLAVPREPNLPAIGDYICATFNCPGETLFRHVQRLPPAHWLIADQRGVAVKRYYDLDPARSIRYATDDQYAEHFLEVFREAVRCRLRAPTAIAAELSGGLDSSSVVVTALALQREEGAGPFPQETFSIVFDEPECDERLYAQEVAHANEIKCNFVAPSLIEYDECLRQVRRYADLPDYVNGAVFDGLRQELVRRGRRVVLTGLGGDQWLQGSEYYLCDFLVRAQIRQLWHQLRTDLRFGTLNTSLDRFRVMLKWGLKPLLPKPTVRMLKWLLRRPQYPHPIERSFAGEINLVERMDNEPSRPPQMSYAQRPIYDAWVSPWLSHLLDMDDRSNAWAGVEGRHPFYDRRVIEFAFAIPEEQRARLDLTKFVLRQAMKGLLPDLVRERRTKGQFGRVFIETFNKIGGERFFDSMTMESQGWVNAARMRQLCRERLGKYPTNLWPLWTTFAVELWFREVFASGFKVSERPLFPTDGLATMG